MDLFVAWVLGGTLETDTVLFHALFIVQKKQQNIYQYKISTVFE
jgi:hypothetical protein